MITQDLLKADKKNGMKIKEICVKYNISQYMYYKLIKMDIDREFNNIGAGLMKASDGTANSEVITTNPEIDTIYNKPIVITTWRHKSRNKKVGVSIEFYDVFVDGTIVGDKLYILNLEYKIVDYGTQTYGKYNNMCFYLSITCGDDDDSNYIRFILSTRNKRDTALYVPDVMTDDTNIEDFVSYFHDSVAIYRYDNETKRFYISTYTPDGIDNPTKHHLLLCNDHFRRLEKVS